MATLAELAAEPTPAPAPAPAPRPAPGKGGMALSDLAQEGDANAPWWDKLGRDLQAGFSTATVGVDAIGNMLESDAPYTAGQQPPLIVSDDQLQNAHDVSADLYAKMRNDGGLGRFAALAGSSLPYFIPGAGGLMAAGQGIADTLDTTGHGIMANGDQGAAATVGLVSGLGAGLAGPAGRALGGLAGRAVGAAIPGTVAPAIAHGLGEATGAGAAYVLPEPAAAGVAGGVTGNQALSDSGWQGLKDAPGNIAMMTALGAPGAIGHGLAARGAPLHELAAEAAPAPAAEAPAPPAAAPAATPAPIAENPGRAPTSDEATTARQAFDARAAGYTPEQLAAPITRSGMTLAQGLAQMHPEQDPIGWSRNVDQLERQASDLARRATPPPSTPIQETPDAHSPRQEERQQEPAGAAPALPIQAPDRAAGDRPGSQGQEAAGQSGDQGQVRAEPQVDDQAHRPQQLGSDPALVDQAQGQEPQHASGASLQALSEPAPGIGTPDTFASPEGRPAPAVTGPAVKVASDGVELDPKDLAGANAAIQENGGLPPPVPGTGYIQSDARSVPLGGGVSRDGKRIYLSRFMPKEIAGKNLDGSPRSYDPRPYIERHERREWTLMHPADGQKAMSYQEAHSIATKEENEALRADGIDPTAHNEALGPALKKASKDKLPPHEDLDDKPYIDSGKEGLLARQRSGVAPGERINARPDLANPGTSPVARDAFKQDLAERVQPETVTNKSTVEKARARIEANHDGELNRVRALRDAGHALDLDDQESVRQLLQRASHDPDGQELRRELSNLWQSAGTGAARVMQARRDAVQTPEGRALEGRVMVQASRRGVAKQADKLKAQEIAVRAALTKVSDGIPDSPTPRPAPGQDAPRRFTGQRAKLKAQREALNKEFHQLLARANHRLQGKGPAGANLFLEDAYDLLANRVKAGAVSFADAALVIAQHVAAFRHNPEAHQALEASWQKLRGEYSGLDDGKPMADVLADDATEKEAQRLERTKRMYDAFVSSQTKRLDDLAAMTPAERKLYLQKEAAQTKPNPELQALIDENRKALADLRSKMDAYKAEAGVAAQKKAAVRTATVTAKKTELERAEAHLKGIEQHLSDLRTKLKSLPPEDRKAYLAAEKAMRKAPADVQAARTAAVARRDQLRAEIERLQHEGEDLEPQDEKKPPKPREPRKPTVPSKMMDLHDQMLAESRRLKGLSDAMEAQRAQLAAMTPDDIRSMAKRSVHPEIQALRDAAKQARAATLAHLRILKQDPPPVFGPELSKQRQNLTRKLDRILDAQDRLKAVDAKEYETRKQYLKDQGFDPDAEDPTWAHDPEAFKDYARAVDASNATLGDKVAEATVAFIHGKVSPLLKPVVDVTSGVRALFSRAAETLAHTVDPGRHADGASVHALMAGLHALTTEAIPAGMRSFFPALMRNVHPDGLPMNADYNRYPAIRGPAGKVIRGIGMLPWVRAQDIAFKMIAFHTERAYWAARTAVDASGKRLTGTALDEHMANEMQPDSESSRLAWAKAVDMTFTGRPIAPVQKLNELRDTPQDTLSGKATQAAVRALAPFTTIPSNILTQAISRHIPIVSDAITVIQALHQNPGEPAYNRAALHRDIGEAAIRWTVAALAVDAAAHGWITGGNDQDHPYSIKLGGHYFSYHKVGPVASAMGMAADWAHGHGAMKDRMGAAGYNLVKSLGGEGIGQTLTMINQAWQHHEMWSYAGGQIAGRTMPGLLTNAAEASQSTMKGYPSNKEDAARQFWHGFIGESGLTALGRQAKQVAGPAGQKATFGNPALDFLWRVTMPLKMGDAVTHDTPKVERASR